MRWPRIALPIALVAFLTSPLLAQDRTAAGQPSIADKKLTKDVWAMIEMVDQAFKPAGCKGSPKLGDRVIVEPPPEGDPRKGKWVENWTVSRCEQQSVYRVEFTPQEKGGTMFGVMRTKE